MYCCDRIHVRFTTQRTHTPTYTHINTPKTKSREMIKLVIPRRGITYEIPRRRGVCSHTRHTLAKRVQARGLTPPHRLVQAVLPLRTRWLQERPSTRCLRRTTPPSSIKNVSTQSPTSQSKGSEQYEGKGATPSGSN